MSDLPFDDGGSLEQALGGHFLGAKVTQFERERARQAAHSALQAVRDLYHPDAIVLCGGVGLSDLLGLELPQSPFEADAGLYGAAALALFPPSP